MYIGDSLYDALGAAQSGLDFAGVTYGFGFKNERDIEAYRHCMCLDDPRDLIDRIEKQL